MKKRVAIWLQGGIGGGNFSQGYPPLLNFVMKLSPNYQLTVYSIIPANEDFVANGFNFRTIHRSIKPRKLRTILILFLFLWDHIRNPYQLLHAFWGYPAGTIAVLLGKIIRAPSLVTIQGGEAAALPQINYGNMLKPWLKKITLWTCKQATGLNFISEFLADQMRRHGLARKDITIIPFGAESTIFNREEKIQGALLRVIHVANLTEVKDQVMLLKAFDLIRKKQPAELRIIGDGTLEQKLRQISNEMGLTQQVHFLGAVPNKELSLSYGWADVMMHTSLHEGQSGVAVEAMMSGVLVCGTRVGIISDLEENCCCTVDVGDFETLAQKVLVLWNDKAEFKRLQENAHQWAREHSASWTVKQFDELYHDMIK